MRYIKTVYADLESLFRLIKPNELEKMLALCEMPADVP